MKKAKIFVIALAIATAFTSCKKNTDATTDDTTSNVTEAKVQAQDATTYDGETDVVDDDVNNTVASSAKFCGVGNAFLPNGINHLPPDVDTTNTGNTPTKIILTFNGNPQSSTCRKRTGQIIIELLNKPRWVEPGALLKYTFVNFKVQDLCKGKSVTFNGERFVTNVNGGNLVRLRLGTVNSLVHQIRNGANGLNVTFTDDSTNVSKTAVWNAARRNEMKFDSTTNAYNVTINGDTTLAGVANTASWGSTRNGKAYTIVINTAVKANTNCKLYKPTQGFITHTVGNFTYTVQHGLDVSGSPVVVPNCPAKYRVSWTAGGGGSLLFDYRL